MAAARKFEWMRGGEAQPLVAVHPGSSTVSAGWRRPVMTASQPVLGAGDFDPGSLEWVATNGVGAMENLRARLSASRRIQQANHPLMLTKSHPKKRYSRILVPVDFSRASVIAAKAVLRAGAGAQLVFLSAFSMSGDAAIHARARRPASVLPPGDVSRAAHTRLARFVEQLDIRDSLVSIVARHGAPGAVTRSYAGLMRADLVVVGRLPVPRLEAVLLGTPEWRLSQAVEGDVLVVPDREI